MKTKLLLLTVFLLLSFKSLCQKDEKSFFNIDGSVGFYYDFYTINNNSVRPRYPDNLWRFNGNVNFHFSKYFSIPVEVSITNQKTLFDLPNLPNENLINYIKNPKNNIAIKPKYKWFQGFLGTHTPQYSKLSSGDISVFGYGLEINPGKFIFSVSHGTSQRPIEANPALFIPGTFEQKLSSFRIGYGKINESKFTINVVKVKDEPNSIDQNKTTIKPVEGITVSPLFEFKIGNKIFVKTETAGSVFTSDINNNIKIKEEIAKNFKSITTINGSSNADFSHNSSISYKSRGFSIGGEVLYMGAGFVPVGYMFVERDILDYKLNTSFKLFKGTTNFRGSLGIRKNNLSQTKLQTSNRFIINSSLFSIISNNLSFNVNYSNFDFNSNRNNNQSQIYRIETVNSNLSIAPNYNFKTKSSVQSVGLVFGLNNFKRFDVVSNKFLPTKTKNLNLNYNISFLNFPLNVSTYGNFINTNFSATSINMKTFGSRATYRIFNNKVIPSLGFNYAIISKNTEGSDNRLTGRFGVKYKITKKLLFNVDYQLNNYNYNSLTNSKDFSENKFRFSLVQNF